MTFLDDLIEETVKRLGDPLWLPTPSHSLSLVNSTSLLEPRLKHQFLRESSPGLKDESSLSFVHSVRAIYLFFITHTNTEML